MKKISIIGAGAYGLSIALALSKKNYNILMWTESEDKVKFMTENRKNTGVLNNIEIPLNISFTNDYEKILEDTEIVFIAVAAKYINSVTKSMKKYKTNNIHFCILSKGIEQNTCNFVSEVFNNNINTKKLAVISGPSFAIDVANDEPIGLSIASKNKTTINKITEVLSSDKIKLRPTKDINGIELCGSIKNVIAIASGIIAGLGYSESTRSFLITESLHDIKELIYALDGNKKTILSFAGVGDLLLTATSTKSRNYSYGLLIGQNKIADAEDYLKNTTVEGYYTLKSIYQLIKRKKVNMPIIDLIYKIIINKENPNKLIDFLIEKN